MSYAHRLKYFGVAVALSSLLAILATAPKAHAADYPVTTTADSGAGSLRQAILDANTNPGADSISFAIVGGGVHTITPIAGMPEITDEVTIDGTTQSGASCGTLVPSLPANSNTPHNLLIEIDASNMLGDIFYTLTTNAANSVFKGLVLNNSTGSGSAAGANTFNFDSTASGITLKGLIVNNPADGWNSLSISGYNPGYSVTVECNYFGTDNTGTSAQTPNESNGISGVLSAGVIQNNLIAGYKSSDQQGTGIVLSGSGFTIQNNLIGTASDGLSTLPNKLGIWLTSSDSQTTPVATISHNIVSGNETVGIKNGVETYAGTNPVIVGNYIGLNVDGSALGNGGDGIYSISASNFIIGGTSATDRNVISANAGNGIHIYSQGDDGSGCYNSSSGQVLGNYIGTNTSGEIANGMGNQQSGVAFNEIDTNCTHGTINQQQVGGDNAGEANIIAGNTLDGVRAYQVPNTGTDVYGIAVLTNQIFGNGNLGINLAADSNGSGTADTDLGPNVINDFLMSYPATNANYYINHPVVNSTAFNGNQLTVNYNFQANGVQDNPDNIQNSNLVGYRLDFYLNENSQDGAYAGYNQGKTHLGSFIVNGSETNATHTFTAPGTLTANQSVSATTTVLWQNISIDECNVSSTYWGSGPPYNSCPQ